MSTLIGGSVAGIGTPAGAEVEHPRQQWLPPEHRPLHHQRRILDEVAHGRNPDGERKVPARAGGLQPGPLCASTSPAGYLSILDIQAWDDYDTVFKVRTTGQQSFLNGVKASTPGLTDGDHTTFWDNGGRLPVSVTLDLRVPRTAAYLAINQREWSPTHARSTFGRPEDSARIKDYRVYVSKDGVRWGQPVRQGTLPSNRGVQFIDIGRQHTRHIKLEVLDTWAGPQAPRFFKQLRIDEIRVASAYPSSFGDRLPLEAEALANRREGRARFDFCAACSGSLQVTGLGGGQRNALTYRNVQIGETGTYRLQIDHTATPGAGLSVSVNNAAPQAVPVTADNPDVATQTAVAVNLNAGANTIKLFRDSATGAGVDRVSIGPPPPASYTPNTAHRFHRQRTALVLRERQRRPGHRGPGGRPGEQHPLVHLRRGHLQPGPNTIRLFNDNASAPDLDRISLGQ